MTPIKTKTLIELSNKSLTLSISKGSLYYWFNMSMENNLISDNGHLRGPITKSEVLDLIAGLADFLKEGENENSAN